MRLPLTAHVSSDSESPVGLGRAPAAPPKGRSLHGERSPIERQVKNTQVRSGQVYLLWVPQSTQNKITIPKKRIQTERKLEAQIATNLFLNQIFLRSSVPSLGFLHPFGQAGGCGGFALRLRARYDRLWATAQSGHAPALPIPSFAT